MIGSPRRVEMNCITTSALRVFLLLLILIKLITEAFQLLLGTLLIVFFELLREVICVQSFTVVDKLTTGKSCLLKVMTLRKNLRLKQKLVSIRIYIENNIFSFSRLLSS